MDTLAPAGRGYAGTGQDVAVLIGQDVAVLIGQDVAVLIGQDADTLAPARM